MPLLTFSYHSIIQGVLMSTIDKEGHTVETVQEATQSENSSDTFVILIISLGLMIAAGLGFAWYYGYLV